jgi:uncharacterized membrane protein YsdA (DUF1294 family)
VLFLAVRRATNACFFILILLALLYLAQQRAAFAAAWRVEGSRMLVAALGSVFAAAVAAKLLRGEFDHVDLDGPSRYLLLGLLLLFLTAKRVQFVRIFAALPLAILLRSLPCFSIPIRPTDGTAASPPRSWIRIL